MNVLVADDSTVVRKHFVEIIRQIRGIDTVMEAECGWEAVTKIHHHKPDVVILDVRMPAGSGIEALDNLGQLTDEITVIMVTAFPYPQYRERCMKAGARYFFNKTTEADRVVDVLKGMAHNRGRPVGC